MLQVNVKKLNKAIKDIKENNSYTQLKKTKSTEEAKQTLDNLVYCLAQ